MVAHDVVEGITIVNGMMTSLLSALAMVIMGVIPESQPEPCPFNPLCTCRRSHHEVTCKGVPFSVFPSLPQDDVYQVTIVRSGLEVLHNESLHGTSVASLHLMHNNLIILRPRSFEGLELLLTTLDVSHNHLCDIPFVALRRLNHLQWLNLYSNEVDDVHVGRWGHLGSRTSLQSLFLGANHITLIPEGAFAKLSNLTVLDLEGNIIHDIGGRSFPISLRSVTLSNNILKKVPLHALYTLQNLRWLHLSGNLFKRLPKPFLLQVPILEKLDLSNNMLTMIPDGVFNGSMKIKDLHLEFNFLRTISAKAFRGTGVERLFLANNRISTVHLEAFWGVEADLTTLDLSFNLLEHFPSALNALTSLLHLSLRGNLLQQLDRHDLKGCRETLEVLDLSGNKLQHVPKKALQNFRHLVRLSLQDNRIEKVYRDDFEGWGHTLSTLSLANNKMTYLSGGTFLYTPKLRELRISFNKLMYLDQFVFTPVRKTLEVLELSSALTQNNHPVEVFIRDLERLEWLQLDHNNISSLLQSSINQLGRLLHLDIEGNDITTVPVDIYTSSMQPRLSTIHMSNNKLKKIHTDAFSGLQRISNLIFYSNEVSVVETGAFSDCPILHTVVLSNNRISMIEKAAFRNLSRLTNVFFQENLLTQYSLDSIEGDTANLYLNLSRNQIVSLEPSSENSTSRTFKVKTLDVSHNHISFLSESFLTTVSESLMYLFLSHNNLRNISFSALPRLQLLQLSHNKIEYLEPFFLQACLSLQILILDHNDILEISDGMFSHMKNLRVLDLSYNQIFSLSEGAFVGTKLERVNLSHNGLARPPFHSLVSVRETMRYLDLSLNKIEFLPAVRFDHLNKLQALNLSSNQIYFLEDHCFAGLRQLLELDMSHNPLRNLEELPLRPLVALQALHINNISINSIPVLPTPRLRSLLLQDNLLYNVTRHTFHKVQNLRLLDVSGNMIQDVPFHLWKCMTSLVTLDLSYNPIEVLGINSFAGLEKLRNLDIRGLQLRRLDPRALHPLRFLTTFKTDSYSSVRSFRLQDLLSQSPALSRVTVNVEENTLSHQLQGAFGTKLRELTVTGSNLQQILPDAFAGLTTHELTMRITGTSVSVFPDGLLKYLPDVRYLTLDLRDNQLMTVGPQVLAAISRDGNDTEGTQHITGGVLLEGNPWNCSCDLLWLGHWLRRWLRETFHVHMLGVEAALYVHSVARRSVCTLPGKNLTRAIISLKPEEVGCHNSKSCSTAVSGTVYVWILVLVTQFFVLPEIVLKALFL